jgi:Concanavalin A-like lectin/glucanases superfamily
MRLKFTLITILSSLSFSFTNAQNTALSFNGTNTTVTTAAFVIPTSGDFTIEFWYFLPSLGTSLQEFVSQGQSGGGFYIGSNNGNGQFRAGDNWQVTGVNVLLNQWAHVALVNAGGNATFYLNGVAMGSTTGYSINTGGSTLTLGQQFSPFSEPFAGSLDQLHIWSVALTTAQVKQSMYSTVPDNSAGLIADYQMNEGTGTTMGNATATPGLDGTLVNSPAWVNSPVQFGSNALTFDGVDDQVIALGSPAFEITSGTVEATINPSTLNTTNMEIAGYRAGGATRYSFHVSNAAIGLWNGTTFFTWDFLGVNAGTPFTIPTGAWTHLSWVTDGTNTTLYVNGSSVGTLTAPFSSAAGLTFDMGVSKNSGVDAEFFQGSIDEVRVWNTQLTPTQINTYMGATLVGNESGLNALFSFDQGNPGNDNTGLITAVDNTANANNATLLNFALTGSTSNFVPSPLIPLPVNIISFTATKSVDGALLQWQTAQEQNSHDFSIQHSTDGSNYTDIGDLAAAGNSTTPKSYNFTDQAPTAGINYYRLKETDLDGRSAYSTVRTLVFSNGKTQQLVWFVTGSKRVEVNLLNGANEYYSLSSIDGRSIQRGQLNGGKLYLSSLASGIYIVNVITFTGQQLPLKVLIP